MRPNISEFSYGYALTDELIHSLGVGITGAPVFPSLYQEGQRGGGWDVQLTRPGVPLFLQFKLSDCMTRSNCQEAKTGVLTVPCYRMHLRPKRFSRQHELLLDLESKGHEVYYSAPAFHEPDQLNEAYLGNQVKARSLWLRPSGVGPLPDDESHHISFKPPPSPWFFSSREPRQMEGPNDFDSFTVHIRSVLDRVGEDRLSPLALEKLADDVARTAEQRPDISDREKAIAERRLSEASPIKRAAYYASVFLESQLFLIQRAEQQRAIR
jgi:hypothetical protein